MDITRPGYLNRITTEYTVHRVCALLGPRQCGKTTLARVYQQGFSGPSAFFDLEDPTDLAKLDAPKLVLEDLEGLIVIDEIQRRPELFPYLRVLADKYPKRRYLILGSASRDLIQQSSETLAGRIGYIELTPFNLTECPHWDRLWHRGGFPPSYLADELQQSLHWRKAYITTFLERDLAQLGFTSHIDMRRLWTMLAHYHGNILNYADLGRSLAISDTSVRRHIDILEGTFMIRVLRPWYENLKKRQVKSPKCYIRDSGLLHSLLNIYDENMRLHPKVGASWEGFAIEQIISALQETAENCYFWATNNQAELDLFILHKGKRLGFEIKYTDSPRVTRSMHIAIDDLKLDQLYVIVPTDGTFRLQENIQVVGIQQIVSFFGSDF